MCYDVKTKLETQLKRARHYQQESVIREIEKELEIYTAGDIHHASGFEHPSVYIYTNQKPYYPIRSIWGLIPPWVKSDEQRLKMWNNTINARGETLFEKPAFRDAVKQNRCVIYVDGFYEHHHFKSKAYPYYIKRKDDLAMGLAGLWSEWLDKSTGDLVNNFTIITTRANALLSKIHNSPKLPEPRMPVILVDSEVDQWLNGSVAAKNEIDFFLKPYPDELLSAYTVAKLRGKESLGNVPEASEIYHYPGLPQLTEI